MLASSEDLGILAYFLTTARPVQWFRFASATARLLLEATTAAIYQRNSSETAEALLVPQRIANEEARDLLLTGLASMSYDGHLRERAVRRLSQMSDPDPLVAPFLVLLIVDNIPATAAIARQAALRLCRRDPKAFILAAPLVNALQRRERMTGFLADFYSIASADAERQRLLLDSYDPPTQRMGLDLALRSGSIAIDELVKLAVYSHDTAVSFRAGKAVVERAKELLKKLMDEALSLTLCRRLKTVRRSDGASCSTVHQSFGRPPRAY